MVISLNLVIIVNKFINVMIVIIVKIIKSVLIVITVSNVWIALTAHINKGNNI